MASIASKNLYDLLGNDSDQDPDREPPPPTKAIDKNAPRGGKRNATEEPRSRGGGASTTSRGGRVAGGNEAAFRDRGAGSNQNRSRGIDEPRGEDSRGRGRGRGGRGGRGGPRDDRHSKTGVSDHEKQVSHGWGAPSGDAEWQDEKAGEDIAKADEKDVEGEVPANGEAEEPKEPETKTKSLEEYLAEQAEKKLQLGGDLEVRKPNEGASKKFPEGKAFSREGEDEDFISGAGGKKSRERQKKEKQLLELDGDRMRQVDTGGDRRGGRGGGRGRGDRGDRGDRGGDRGDRPDRGDRAERGDRGDFGGRGRGDRGRGRADFRGGDRGGRGRGGRGGNAPNVSDKSAFPSLGS